MTLVLAEAVKNIKNAVANEIENMHTNTGGKDDFR